MASPPAGLSHLEKRYLENLSREAGSQHPLHQILKSASDLEPTIYCLYTSKGCCQHDASVSAQPMLESLEFVKADTVCVIESINANWMATLGVEWGLRPSFFLDYAYGERDSSLWDEVMGHEAAQVRLSEDRQRPHRIIEGLISDVKAAEKDGPDSLGVPRPRDRGDRGEERTSTRISYLRVRRNLYVFLVDPPIEPNPPQFVPYSPSLWDFRPPDDLRPSKLMMKVHADNIAGYSIPQLYHQRNLSCFSMLQSFLSHPWHMDLLFGCKPSETVDPTLLSQYLTVSLLRTNLMHVHRSLRRISFRTLKYNPDMSTNQDLHGFREDLETLRAQVAVARDWMPDLTQCASAYSTADWNSFPPPKDTLKQILEDATDVQRFLMDTFQLLMSTVSVRVSESSIAEAKRSIVLTQLATVYVPLSFVTGIWGMNIREINDSPRPLWMFGVTLVAALLVTAAALAMMRNRREVWSWMREAPRKLEVFLTLYLPWGLQTVMEKFGWKGGRRMRIKEPGGRVSYIKTLKKRSSLSGTV